MTLRDSVCAIMRGVAANSVTPRFRMLAAHEISEKSPGEIVTSVDREAEAWLHDGLAALGLGARIVGEEAVALEPHLLHDIDDGLVWLIDPLDGTANFAAGHGPFGMMVALVQDGIPLEGWILDPLSGRLCHARRGGGATCDGRPVRTTDSRHDRPKAALGTQFLDPAHRDRLHGLAETRLDTVAIPRCAAESYARLVLGTDDIAMFQRILPWDHAAGVLFLTEAGGHATHWDGSPFRIGGPGTGVLAAANRHLWHMAADVLLTPAAGLQGMEALHS